jgi:hypothetical protein
MIARTPQEVRDLLGNGRRARLRTLVAIDYSNVRRWGDTLGWDINVRNLGRMARSFSEPIFLRRFYCAADFGPDWRSKALRVHSTALIAEATASGFEVVVKRVKFMQEEGG